MPVLHEFVFPLVFISLFFGVAAWWPLEGQVSSRLGTIASSPLQGTAIVTDTGHQATAGTLVVK